MKNIVVKVLIGLLALLGVTVGGNEVYQQFGARLTTSQITMFTTTTNANYSSMTPTNVSSFRHIEIEMVGVASSGTLKFACSNQPTAPTIGGSQSATNRYDYVQVIDKEDGSSIDGDTGVTLSDTTDVREFEVNDNFSTWCWSELSGNTTPAGYGTTTVYFKSASN